ncbi:MAG TPA: Flp family type IVb pilin [Candidatus Acidoferrales bacterium]|nr:Flp family type IVb pilin [Candidatus Acidoferrales bacterium]
MFYLRLRRFLEAERAQDLIEYTLLIAFVALVAVGLMSQVGNGLQGLWGSATSTMAVANASGPGPVATNPTLPGGGDGGGGRDRDGH